MLSIALKVPGGGWVCKSILVISLQSKSRLTVPIFVNAMRIECTHEVIYFGNPKTVLCTIYTARMSSYAQKGYYFIYK